MTKTISKHRCIHCLVYGRVQGVFFRASTRSQAESLGLVGYAKNLTDGSVEVVACGSQTALEQFKAWLHIGPRSAQVSQVECRTITSKEFKEFKIL